MMFEKIRNTKYYTPKFKAAIIMQKTGGALRTISTATSDKRAQFVFATAGTLLTRKGKQLFLEDAHDPKKPKERI